MTIDRRTLFERWAPPASPWAEWAKPVFFALMNVETQPPAVADQPPPDLRWMDHDPRPMAVIVDLAGAESLRWAAAFVARGFAAVPLFNCAPGPNAVINSAELARALLHFAPSSSPPPADAPPCFILDADRNRPGVSPAPGQFDNRWLIFPQDFPSAAMLMSRSLRAVVVVQERPGPVAEDLAHILLSWQRAGVAILRQQAGAAEPPEPIDVKRPRGYRSTLRRLMVTLGLRHNSAGGFGSIVPDLQTSGVGYA